MRKAPMPGPDLVAPSHDTVAGEADSGVPVWQAHYPANLSFDKHYDPRALGDMFDHAVERFAMRTCTIFLGKSTSYGDLGRQTNQIARGLQALGIGKGDRVGLLLPNSPTYVACFFAILKTGACVVNFNPLYTVPELEHQVKDAELDLMITFDLALLFDKVEALLQSGILKQAVVASFTSLLPVVKAVLFRLARRKEIAFWRTSPIADRLIPLEGLAVHDDSPSDVKIDPETDLAVLQYTGGTTGTPKGAMLTHANLSINVEQVTDWAGELQEGERVMGILPFFHVFAMTTILNFGIANGATLILMPKFELEEALALIARQKPTIMPGVPTLYSAMLNHPGIEAYDLSSLKFCFSGGAGLPVEVRRQFEELTGCALIEGYGLSETSPVVTGNPLAGSMREGSIGVPLAATHISIRSLDDPAVEMPCGEKGEICIRGPQVMPGYWKKPEETKTVFTGNYFRTGDIGYMAEDGFIYVVDRLKDMINASGFKIYPRQVEDAIYRFPVVEEVTVVGMPDDYRGEAPKAFIKLKEGERADADEIMQFLAGEISKPEMPAEIEFRDSLPKTLIGKLSRKELRDEF